MSPIDPKLIEILVCPETKQSITPADAELIARLNTAGAEGKLVNRGGEKVEKQIDEGFIREDREYLYPVIEGIPVMLIDQGIPLKDYI